MSSNQYDKRNDEYLRNYSNDRIIDLVSHVHPDVEFLQRDEWLMFKLRIYKLKRIGKYCRHCAKHDENVIMYVCKKENRKCDAEHGVGADAKNIDYE